MSDCPLSSFPAALLCLSVPSLTCFALSVSAGASEGKMVVLALAIGVAEQDDFANIPDLQETAQAAPPANQEAPPDKRYRAMHECELCVAEWRDGVRQEASGRPWWMVAPVQQRRP